MSRTARLRALVGVALALSLIGGAVAVLAAAPAKCPTYTDPAGDSGPASEGDANAVAGDDDLDLLAVTHSVDRGDFRTTFRVVKLLPTGPDFAFGDRFISNFTVAGKAVTVTAERDFSGVGSSKASARVAGTAVTFPVKLVVDLKASTLTAVMSAASFATAVGGSTNGAPFTLMSATARNIYPTNGSPSTLQPDWDTATPKPTDSYAFGASCGGGTAAPAAAASPSPSASRSPSPSPSASRSPSPTASAGPPASGSAAPAGASGACPTYTDPASDAGPGGQSGANSVAGDDDLDLVAVTHSVAGDDFTTTFKVVKLLASGPDFAFGDRFRASFTVAGKAVTVTAERDFSGLGSKSASATVAGTAVTFPVKLVEDVKGSAVGAVLSAAALVKAAGVPLVGQPFTAMSATAGAIYPSNAASSATVGWDTATAPATASYAFGAGCGGSAAVTTASATATATLAVSAPSRVQTGDVQSVAVTVAGADGKPASGATVTGKLGGGPTASGKTNANGRAILRVAVTGKAGRYPLVVQSGKTTVRRTTTVLAERSLLDFTVNGAGDTRLVTITLTDDDEPRHHPYADTTVTFAYSGQTVTATTDSRGSASIRVKTGTKLDMSYAGKPGFITSATRRTEVG